ncbi:MAG: TetR family transcriptional regulator [Leptospirales bacterium]|jgi:AcrR family transcriptional regulator
MPRQNTASLPVPERLLTVATRLFRSRGYAETGINRILEEAGVARASLYLHYPTKEALGQAYLRSYSDSQFALLAELMRRAPEPAKFVTAWARILKREARDAGLHGCAIANLRSQTPTDQKKLQTDIRDTALRTIDAIQNYVRDCQQAGKLPAQLDAGITARRIFIAYEGAMQAYQLTSELESIDDFAEIARRLLTE